MLPLPHPLSLFHLLYLSVVISGFLLTDTIGARVVDNNLKTSGLPLNLILSVCEHVKGWWWEESGDGSFAKGPCYANAGGSEAGQAKGRVGGSVFFTNFLKRYIN